VSTFSIISAIGVPVVISVAGRLVDEGADMMRTASGSRRWVVKRDWPGRRLSSQCWMLSSLTGIRGGQPSTTAPIAGPWLSPQVVTRKRWPKVLWDMQERSGWRSVRRF
jgi:hypothetical protein